MGPSSPGTLVEAAAAGDQRAFDQLVERFSGLVWSIARGYRLADADAEEVFQTTWLRLVENLTRLREPEAVGGWLATTARRECLRVLRHAGRMIPSGDDDLELVDDDAPEPDHGVLTDERDRALWQAFGQLGERCRRLLRVLAADPPPSYADVSAALDMPVGSIGPTRGRCLEQLRRRLRGRGITVPSRASSS